ncbi:MAG TPA: hypothetical protein VFA88_07255 [Gaiellaceae bacterium]|nr:hypothetical protein [Gaiellaceae bacterium]
MERLAVIARLKPATEAEAEELIAAGPPFDPAAAGFLRHSVFLAPSAVIFVFEAAEVEWRVDDLVDAQFFHPLLAQALAAWQPLIEGQPQLARERFFWQRGAAAGEGG